MPPLLRLAVADSTRAYRVAWVVVLATAAAIAAALALRGCSPVLVYANDVTIQLDGGWRILQGQRPHADFFSPIGPLVLWITALGMSISPTADAIAFANAVCAPLLMLWALWIAARRMPALHAAVLALFVGLLVAAPRYLDASFDLPTYGTLYNRYGYALLAILVVDCLLPRRGWGAGISTGVALGLLAFLKLNYFGVGVGAVALRLVLFPRDARWTLVAGGAAFVVLATGAFALGDAGAFLADMARVSAAQDTAARGRELVADVTANLHVLIMLGALALLARPLLEQPRRALICFAFLSASAIAICATNAESVGLPLAGVAGIVLLAPVREPGRLLLASTAITLALVGLVMAPDAAALAYASAWGESEGRVDTASLRAMPLARERLTDDYGAITSRPPDGFVFRRSSAEYGQMVNDGIKLLGPHVKDDSRISVMDFSNPFPFALGKPSPKGDALWWHVGKTFDEEHHPPAERAYGDTTLLLIPKWPLTPEESRLLQRIYGPYVDAHFTRVAESRLWSLFERIDRR